MQHSVVGLFNNREQARAAVDDLVSTAGFTREQVSIITPGEAGASPMEMASDVDRVEKGQSVVTDTVAGALFGGAGGALLGVLALAIPGLGPVLAAGPIAATIAGITTGAAGGAAIGVLEEAGIGSDETHLYAEAIQRGGTLVTVTTSEENAGRVRDLLNNHDAADVDDHELPPEGRVTTTAEGRRGARIYTRG